MSSSSPKDVNIGGTTPAKRCNVFVDHPHKIGCVTKLTSGMALVNGNGTYSVFCNRSSLQYFSACVATSCSCLSPSRWRLRFCPSSRHLPVAWSRRFQGKAEGYACSLQQTPQKKKRTFYKNVRGEFRLSLHSTGSRELELHGDRLQLRVLLQAILAQLSADPRLLEAAKWRAGIKHVVAIHPHRTRANAVGDGMSFADIARPDGSSES